MRKALLSLTTIALVSPFNSYAIVCSNPYNEVVSLSKVSTIESEVATRECIAKKLNIRQKVSEKLLAMYGVKKIERRIVDYCSYTGNFLKIFVSDRNGKVRELKAHFLTSSNLEGVVEFSCDEKL